jgi:hypothetical protein
MDPSKDKPREERPRSGGARGFSGGDRGPRRFGGRRFRDERRFDDRRPSSGPHFPTSRFLNDKKDFNR